MPNYKFTRKQLTTKEEVEEAMKGMPEWARSLTAFLYLFGCRVSEALQLKKEDFTITETALQVSIPLLKKRRANGPYAPMHVLQVSMSAPFAGMVAEWVQGVKPGQRVWPRTRVRAWQVIKKTKEDLSPHLFRHDRLSKLALAGADGAALMEWAGWVDLRPAANYLHMAGKKAAEFSDKVQ
ncbi:MAG: tyrosine-type recombinase/integrase [Candidatus Methanosuratincola sp.]|jgi:integrase